MTWTILNAQTNRLAKLEGCESVTFGTHDSCDVVVAEALKPLVQQLFFEDCFVFAVQEKQIKTEFQNASVSIASSHFMLESTEPLSSFEKRTLDDSEIDTIFRSSEYKQLLRTVQTVEGPRLYKSTTRDIDVIRATLAHLDDFFWRDHHPSQQNHRKKAIECIWAVWAQMCRFGIITQLIDNPSVSEVMVNHPQQIFIEQNGRLFKTKFTFDDPSDLLSLIERIAARGGRRIDQSIPYCDTRLADGSRVHAIIPPLSLNGPCLTIRKFPNKAMQPERLIELGSAPACLIDKLREVVAGRANIVVSGGTGSGKTTLLNVLSSFVNTWERVITIEDSAELQLQQSHVIRLESRIANVEGKGEVSLRELVRNSLRMRPDRIIVGECRGGEALDMLQAMNTGHDGSMTTTHANSPQDALRRIETLVMFANVSLPSKAIREQIAAAVHYVVQQTRFSDGARRVSAVHRIIGFDDETQSIKTESMAQYDIALNKWVGQWIVND